MFSKSFQFLILCLDTHLHFYRLDNWNSLRIYTKKPNKWFWDQILTKLHRAVCNSKKKKIPDSNFSTNKAQVLTTQLRFWAYVAKFIYLS